MTEWRPLNFVCNHMEINLQCATRCCGRWTPCLPHAAIYHALTSGGLGISRSPRRCSLRHNLSLTWSTITVNDRSKPARSPFGGSLVTLMLIWRRPMGNLGWGSLVMNSRKSTWQAGRVCNEYLRVRMIDDRARGGYHAATCRNGAHVRFAEYWRGIPVCTWRRANEKTAR